VTSPSSSPPDLKQKRILVVEDELMIRMLLEDMLAELGCTIAAEATHIKDALEAVRNAEFDVAILDVNLGGEPISPVADALAARGTPFVFATGYGERALEPWARRVFEWTRQSLDVFVYFNNDMEGHAIKDARTLISMVAGISET